MKITGIFWIILFGFFQVGHAQQNLFNIPSGDITPKNKFFFQHQSNLYTNQWQYLESKNHLVYGLGGGWEIGVNVINIKMDYSGGNGFFVTNYGADVQAPMKPIAVLTAQKQWALGEAVKLSVGTLSGFNINQFERHRHFTHYTYGLAVWQPLHKLRLVAGPYVTDRRFAGPGANVGVQAGFEYHLTDRLWLMGDFISGNSAISTSVAGVNYNVGKRVQLCLGKLIPNPGSPAYGAVVFELNLLGFDLEH